MLIHEGDLEINSESRLELFNNPSSDNLMICGNLHLRNLDTLENLRIKRVEWNVFVYCENLKSLSGIGRNYIKEASRIYLPHSIESSILGLCLIKNAVLFRTLTLGMFYNSETQKMMWTNNGVDSVPYEMGASISNIENRKLINALKIVESYLITKDINDCQEELIEKGFKEYAKL